MWSVSGAQAIRPYDAPISIVWTQGEPCDEAYCALLTAALACGDADIIEHGRWGPYNAILCWPHPDARAAYFLVEAYDTQSDDAP
jgi:hypothetical protein